MTLTVNRFGNRKVHGGTLRACVASVIPSAVRKIKPDAGFRKATLTASASKHSHECKRERVLADNLTPRNDAIGPSPCSHWHVKSLLKKMLHSLTLPESRAPR